MGLAAARNLCLLLLMAIVMHAAAQTDPNAERTYTEHATRLNKDLLEDYDFFVPPTSDRDGASRAGTEVRLQVRFYKIEEIAVQVGSMKLKVWLRMKWQDQRLSWDPADYGGITYTYLLACGHNKPEETWIWVPDITVLNLGEVGMSDALSGQRAMVYSDGTVFWSRPGILGLLCRFSGLVAFPFDKLTCTFEMAGWTTSDTHQRLSFYEEGASMLSWKESGREWTTGVSYSEYDIERVDSELQTLYFGADPYTYARYTLHIDRISSYYWLLVVVPCILMNIFSFSVFWLHPNVGERLGYGITLILATEVFKLVVSDVVPVCGELLWVDLFTNLCSLFCFMSLLESCCVLSIYHRPVDSGLRVLGFNDLADLIHTRGAWMHSTGDPTLSAAAPLLLELKRQALHPAGLSQGAPSGWPHTSPPPSPPSTPQPPSINLFQGLGNVRFGPPPSDSEQHGSPPPALKFPGMEWLTQAEKRHETPKAEASSSPNETSPLHRSNSMPMGKSARLDATAKSLWPSGRARKGNVTLGAAYDEQHTKVARKLQAAFKGRRTRKRAIKWLETEAQTLRRLLKFESIFFQLDGSGAHDGFLSIDELRTFMSYAAMERSVEARVAALRYAATDCHSSMQDEKFASKEARRKQNGNGEAFSFNAQAVSMRRSMTTTTVDMRALGNKVADVGQGISSGVAGVAGAIMGKTTNRVSRYSFVRVCSTLLMDTPDEVLDAAVEVYLAAVSSATAKRHDAVVATALAIDENARVILPSFYLFTLFLMFGVQLDDPYTPSSNTTIPPPMFEGLAPFSYYTAWSVVAMILVPVVVACLYAFRKKFKAWLQAREMRRRLREVHDMNESTTFDFLYGMETSQGSPSGRMARRRSLLWTG